MRFHEPDVREAYRRGVRDCYESLLRKLKTRDTRELEVWLNHLDAWEDGDPPSFQSGSTG